MGSVEIKIFGQQYKIKADAPDEYLQEIARYVEAKIKEVMEQSPSTAPLKATIVAAMSIAEELFSYKRDTERLKKQLEEQTEELTRLFD